jgi:hypothetical protein
MNHQFWMLAPRKFVLSEAVADAEDTVIYLTKLDC